MSLAAAPRRRIWARWRRLVVLLVVLILLTAWAVYIGRKFPMASPFTSTRYLVQQIGHPHARLDREIAGFLPYWQQDDARYVPLNLLSEVVFFALTADEHGQLVTETNGKPEPGWRAWNSPVVRD